MPPARSSPRMAHSSTCCRARYRRSRRSFSAELQVRLGKRDLGLAAVEKAIAATRRIRSGSLSAESRARFIASRREQDELRICLFAGCAALPQAPRDASASLLASEDARAGMLAELVAGATVRRQSGVHDDAARGQMLSEIDARLARVDALSDRPIANARELEALRRSILDAQTRLQTGCTRTGPAWRTAFTHTTRATAGAPAGRDDSP